MNGGNSLNVKISFYFSVVSWLVDTASTASMHVGTDQWWQYYNIGQHWPSFVSLSFSSPDVPSIYASAFLGLKKKGKRIL